MVDAPPADGFRRAATTGVAWSLVQSWGGRIVSTAAFVVLARALDPEAFGVVALAVIFIDLGQMVINRGFGTSIVQRQDLTDEDLDSAFWFCVGMGVALAAVFCLSAELVADAFDEPLLAPVLRVLALNWVFGALSSVPQSILQRQLRFRSLAFRRLIAVTVSGFVGIVLALAGAGVWSLVAMALVQSGVGVVVLWSVSSWRPRWRLSTSRLRNMGRFAASVVATDLVNFLAVRGEGLVIGARLGPIPLGYYAVAAALPATPQRGVCLDDRLRRVPSVLPSAGSTDRRERALLAVGRMTSLFAFPAFAGLAVLAPDLIEAVLGPQWQPSVVLTQLLALHGLRYSITYFISIVVVSTGNAGLELRLTILGFSIKAVALVIGLQWGVVGVTWAVVATTYVTLPISLWSLRRTTGVTARRYLQQVTRPAAAALVMVSVVLGMRVVLDGLDAGVTLAVCFVVAVTSYLGTLAVIGPDLLAEVRTLLGDVRRKQAPTATQPRAVPS